MRTQGEFLLEGFYIIKRKKTIFNSQISKIVFINNSVRRFVSVDDTTMIAEGYSGLYF